MSLPHIQHHFTTVTALSMQMAALEHKMEECIMQLKQQYKFHGKGVCSA
jgi:hypothetical protein